MHRSIIQTRSQKSHHHAGVAMLMVIIAMAMATIMAVSFLSTQTTTTAVAQNISHHSEARAIAESGLVLAIALVNDNPNWRTDYTHGVWLANEPFGNGTYTITGEDGADTDGDGIVEGDGDLADDDSDLLTLTVIGTFEGVTHTVRATVSAGTEQTTVRTIAVADKIEVKGGKNASKTSFPFIDSWDSSLGSYAATKGSAAIVSTNSKAKKKIKVKEYGEIRGDVYVGPGGNPNQVIKIESNGDITGNKDDLDETVLIPGVAEPSLGASIGNVLYDTGTTTLSADMHCNKFEIKNSARVEIDGNITIFAEGNLNIHNDAELVINAGGSLNFYIGSNTSKIKLKIENDAKVNVDGGVPEDLKIYNVSKKKLKIKGDAQVFAVFVMPRAELKLKDNAQVYGSLVGNKLKLEGESQFHHDLREVVVNADDVFMDPGGADYGFAAEDKVEIKGGKGGGTARVDGWGVTARVSTNSTYADMVKVKKSGTIVGDVYVGARGDPNTVIKLESGGTIVGTTNSPEAGVTIPDTDPPDIGATVGDVTYTTGTTQLKNDLHCDTLTLTGDAILEIKGDVVIVADGDLNDTKVSALIMNNTAQIQLANSGSSLTLYTLGKVIMQNDAKINTDDTDPEKVVIYHSATKHFDMKNDSEVYATVVVSASDFHMKDHTVFWGTVRAYKAKVEGDAQAHVTLGIGPGPVDNGAESGGFTAQWIEVP